MLRFFDDLTDIKHDINNEIVILLLAANVIRLVQKNVHHFLKNQGSPFPLLKYQIDKFQ